MTISPRSQFATRRFLLLGASALAVAGCTSKYSVQPVSVPDAFDGKAPDRPEYGIKWWKGFKDPALDKLISMGHGRNLSLQSAIQEVRISEAAIGTTNAPNLPQVGLSGNNTWTNTPSGVTESSTTGVNVSWLVDIFGAGRNAEAAAQARHAATLYSAIATRLMIEGAIASAYVDARYHQNALRLTRASLESRRKTLHITRQRVELGDASRLEVIQAEQLVADGEAQLPQIEVNVDKAYAKLASLTASRMDTIRKLLSSTVSVPSPALRPGVGIPADLVRFRPDVQVQERLYAAAIFDIGVAEAAFLPSVRLGGQISPHSSTASGFTPWSFGPSIDLPIFRAGALTSNLKISEAKAVKAHIAFQQSVITAIEEVETGLAAYNRDTRSIAAQQRLVSTSKEAVDLAKTLFEGGSGTFMSVLDAERSLMSARQSYASAQRLRALNYVSVCLASAGGAFEITK